MIFTNPLIPYNDLPDLLPQVELENHSILKKGNHFHLS